MKKADEGVGRAMEAMVQVGRGFRKEEGLGFCTSSRAEKRAGSVGGRR